MRIAKIMKSENSIKNNNNHQNPKIETLELGKSSTYYNSTKENKENNENFIIPFEKYKNHENPTLKLKKNKIMKIVEFHRRITKIMKIIEFQLII